MHGNNEVRTYNPKQVGLQVHEVFYTFQGEGPYVGYPSVFVRLSGCNLRCWFCDTHWDDAKDPYLSVRKLVGKISALATEHPACKLLVLTGGEPCRQPLDAFFALFFLMFPDWRIQVETAGTIWQDALNTAGVDVVVSPKTPLVNSQVAAIAVAYKYVVRYGEISPNGIPTFATQNTKRSVSAELARPIWPTKPIYLSPCDEGDEEKNARNREAVTRTALKHGYRAGIQLHKILGVP